MMSTPDERLAALGVTLPTPAKPVANYVGWIQTGNLVFTAGQLPFDNGKLTQTGILGRDVEKDAGKIAARQAAINVIAQIKDACGGDLSLVKRIVKLTGFVACTANFTDQPFVVNGASDLMVEVFGEAGRHARSAVGVAALPLNACVEIEAIIELG
jgi:enamine deaminase RidA (YjgF/YER057c/UK114 family)